ncbi:MAG TPA: integrase arm-type DNA-binding domain-containing protein [Rhodocyclaceae bacterium]|nr:integrase arm-type DNA-binding domain-containing protein [Rhodocyclaceae bacterium]
MALSDIELKNAKTSHKPLKLSDGKGLFLLVHSNGSKYWRWSYRFDGKQKTLALGVYPDVSLKKARADCEDARKLLATGTDPGLERKSTKSARKIAAANTFETIAREWYKKTAPSLADSTRTTLLRRLETDVFPWIGSRPIADLVAPDLLQVIRRVENRGATDVAKRVHNVCGRIFRYAVGHGIAQRDPSRDIELKDVLAPVAVQHHASVKTPEETGELLRAISGYTGSFVSRSALQFAPLVFVRPGELRHAEWSEFNLDKAEWRIPASKMKMDEQHIIPLSSQALKVLREIQPLTGAGRYVFPSERSAARPMSENTINAALRRMGYTNEEHTGHGFRSTASTLLHELGWPHTVIERQLAHGERNKVAAAYNFAEYLPERKKMMQVWADYLDKLRVGAEVVNLHSAAA